MRKFTLILASMFLTLGTWAQTVVTTINTERAYTLECCSGVAHSTARFIGVTDAGVINGQASTAAYITFENGTEAGSYYIKVGEKYINYNGTNLSASTSKTTAWVLGTVGQTVTFKYPDATKYLNNNGTACTDGTITGLQANNHPSGPNAGNACSTWQMCEYDLNNSVEVTYNYMFNGVQRKSATVIQMVGAAYEAPAIDYVTLAYPDGSVTKETTTVQVTCTQNLPFTVSTDYANATWYYMTIRSNSQKYVARSENAPYANSTTITAGDNGLWAFKGNVFEGIQVINKGAGDGFTLGYAGTATGANVSMTEAETTWTIEKGTNGFVLRQGENEYAHDYNSKLQIWNNTSAAGDAGSAFNVFSAEELTNTQKTALQKLIDQAGTYEAGTTIGYYTEAAIASLATPLAEANTALSSSSLEDVLNATTALQDAINKMEVILPTAGKFYRFSYDFGDAGVKYIQAVASGVTNKANAMLMNEEQGAASIFYYADDKLLSYSTGLYVNDKGGNRGLQAVGGDAGAVRFEAGTVLGKLYIYAGDSFHANIASDVYFVDHCSTPHAPQHNFTIEEVTTLPVAVSAAGYATLYAPVALTIADGVTAYTAAVADGYLALTEVEGTIPANTGVILEADPETYNFAVAADVAEIEDNALVGAYAKSEKNAEAKVYTLQNGDNGVGFYLFNGYSDENDKEGTKTYINGFRAWVEVENGEAAPAMFSLGRGEGTTGIEAAVNGEQTVVIYDLAGRRVEKMEKGIYIVNGKKVIR